MTVLMHRRFENNSFATRREIVVEARERAEAAASKARTTLRLTIQMAAHAVNDELDHVANAQAVARACLLDEDIDSTCSTIEHYLDDLLFQPLLLLRKESEPAS